MAADRQLEIHGRAALRVRNLDNAQVCASELERLGFAITSVSAHGVGFEGPVELFESVFSSQISDAASRPHFAITPVIPAALEGLVESVYFPTRPIHFA